ncbi:hypothetical protein BGZ54_008271 [Gamsiella multidivaricata]|nr:hypothetical protein BGZ54_008271 [Gamsiella multidivaricata]
MRSIDYSTDSSVSYPSSRASQSPSVSDASPRRDYEYDDPGYSSARTGAFDGATSDSRGYRVDDRPHGSAYVPQKTDSSNVNETVDRGFQDLAGRREHEWNRPPIGNSNSWSSNQDSSAGHYDSFQSDRDKQQQGIDRNNNISKHGAKANQSTIKWPHELMLSSSSSVGRSDQNIVRSPPQSSPSSRNSSVDPKQHPTSSTMQPPSLQQSPWRQAPLIPQSTERAPVSAVLKRALVNLAAFSQKLQSSAVQAAKAGRHDLVAKINIWVLANLSHINAYRVILDNIPRGMDAVERTDILLIISQEINEIREQAKSHLKSIELIRTSESTLRIRQEPSASSKLQTMSTPVKPVAPQPITGPLAVPERQPKAEPQATWPAWTSTPAVACFVPTTEPANYPDKERVSKRMLSDELEQQTICSQETNPSYTNQGSVKKARTAEPTSDIGKHGYQSLLWTSAFAKFDWGFTRVFSLFLFFFIALLPTEGPYSQNIECMHDTRAPVATASHEIPVVVVGPTVSESSKSMSSNTAVGPAYGTAVPLPTFEQPLLQTLSPSAPFCHQETSLPQQQTIPVVTVDTVLGTATAEASTMVLPIVPMVTVPATTVPMATSPLSQNSPTPAVAQDSQVAELKVLVTTTTDANIMAANDTATSSSLVQNLQETPRTSSGSPAQDAASLHPSPSQTVDTVKGAVEDTRSLGTSQSDVSKAATTKYLDLQQQLSMIREEAREQRARTDQVMALLHNEAQQRRLAEQRLAELRAENQEKAFEILRSDLEAKRAEAVSMMHKAQVEMQEAALTVARTREERAEALFQAAKFEAENQRLLRKIMEMSCRCDGEFPPVEKAVHPLMVMGVDYSKVCSVPESPHSGVTESSSVIVRQEGNPFAFVKNLATTAPATPEVDPIAVEAATAATAATAAAATVAIAVESTDENVA